MISVYSDVFITLVLHCEWVSNICTLFQLRVTGLARSTGWERCCRSQPINTREQLELFKKSTGLTTQNLVSYVRWDSPSAQTQLIEPSRCLVETSWERRTRTGGGQRDNRILSTNHFSIWRRFRFPPTSTGENFYRFECSNFAFDKKDSKLVLRTLQSDDDTDSQWKANC